MKSLTWLAVRMLTDVSMQCATTPLRDIITMKRRIEHEGISFLTITLPSFEKGFVRALSLGCAAPDLFPGFHTRKGQSLPAFLQGLTELVFDVGTGCIHTNPSITAIKMIRQFCLFFKKVHMECTPARVNASLRRFEECDAEIVASHAYRGRLGGLESTSRILAAAVFSGFQDDQREKPKHGPGATAERVTGNAKYSVRTWWRNLDRVLPVDQYLFTSCEHMSDPQWGIQSVACVDVQSPPVRVVTVPKTQTTPRVIAIEPVTMQYAQQQCSIFMVKAMESHCLTRGVINFTNQGVNREKAITSSSSGVYATLDLSEASDRVSASLVSRGFRSVPDLRRVLFGTRSATACLPCVGSHGDDSPRDPGHGGQNSRPPVNQGEREIASSPLGPIRGSRDGTPSGDIPTKDGGDTPRGVSRTRARTVPGKGEGGRSRTDPKGSAKVIRLRKFAAMGSALCFPVEAFMFYTIGMNAILRRRGLRPTQRNLLTLKGLLYVYGDDIICHQDEVAAVIEDLEYFGLKINASKSFRTGKFRESCGMDAYDGECVTPTYLRHLPPCNRQSNTELISWISTANLLYEGGLWMTASAMREHVEKVLGKLPHVHKNSSVLGWHSFLGSATVERWNVSLHRFEVKGYVPKPRTVKDPIDGYPALLKCLLKGSSEEPDGLEHLFPLGTDAEHLDKTVRSGIFTLKRRWAAAH